MTVEITFSADDSDFIRERAVQICEEVKEVGWYGFNSVPATERGLCGEIAVARHLDDKGHHVEVHRTIYGGDLLIDGDIHDEVKECGEKWRKIRGGFPLEPRHVNKYVRKGVRRIWLVERLQGWRPSDNMIVKIHGWVEPQWVRDNCEILPDTISDKEGKVDYIVKEVDIHAPSSV